MAIVAVQFSQQICIPVKTIKLVKFYNKKQKLMKGTIQVNK